MGARCEHVEVDDRTGVTVFRCSRTSVTRNDGEKQCRDHDTSPLACAYRCNQRIEKAIADYAVYGEDGPPPRRPR